MRKLTILFILGFLLMHSGSYACSCAGRSTVEGGIKQADAVLVGKIISKERVTLVDSVAIKQFGVDSTAAKGYPYTTFVAKYQLAVTANYKGKTTSDTIAIYTGLGGGDCGVRFQIGESYIVYGDDETYFGQRNNDWPYPKGDNIYWTNSCTRTAFESSKEISEIEKYRRKK